MSEHQKRIEPRAPIEVKVEYQHLNALVSDYTKNLSKGGIFLPGENHPEIGTQLYLTIIIPEMSDPIIIEGVVKHHDAIDGVVGFGVEFVYADEEEKRALEGTFDKLIFDHLGQKLYESLRSVNQS